ncbi:MAG: D-alanine--D-alanine ligase [Massilia sp.]|nr:D-alanine--D-alanine ligase [Massilia sp.]
MPQATNIDVKALGKVGVLFGGRSAERDISIMSGSGVLAALQSRGVDAHGFDTGTRDLTELAAQAYDRVFIALHGRFGEDGSLQGALEQLGIAYTGSGVMASAVAMDKIATKMMWLQKGLPTPTFAEIEQGADLDKIAAQLGLPLIVKPPHEGSTIGITKVENAGNFQAAVDVAHGFDDIVLAEQFITGREFTVAILGAGSGARALPICEIVAPQGNYDYQNKYFTDDVKYFCPADLSAELAAEMQRLALAAYRALGCEGWGRIDFMLRTEDSKPFLIEANTSPGMTGHSLVPMAARAVGISYEDLCIEIVVSARLKLHKEQVK